MCWLGKEVIPIVLKKPLKVYKLGTHLTKNKFVTAYKKYTYTKHTKLPTIQLVPKFYVLSTGKYWHRIFEGYHAYLTIEVAKQQGIWVSYESIGEFEIPAGALVYINFKSDTIVSSDIKYMGIVKN